MLVLSQHVAHTYAVELLGDSAEGLGYLLKDRVADVDEFTAAVRRVADGGSALDPLVVAELVGRNRGDDPIERLSPREREVLELMAEGRTNQAIGQRLFISPRAVEKHVTSIFTEAPAPGRARGPPSRARGAALPRLVVRIPAPSDAWPPYGAAGAAGATLSGMPGERQWRVAREVGLIAVAYFGGELFRGLADGGTATAIRHADAIERVERRLHMFGEADVQRAVHHVAGLPTFLGYAYLTAHVALTAAVLVWVYRRHRHAYTRLRNTLVLANAIGVVGYVAFPTAPPRLAGVGVADTVSGATSIDLSSSVVSSFYNPYAAFPSMHIGFALIVGAAIWRLARRPLWRAAGVAYPLFVLLVIVATGNHFFADAAAGAAVAIVAAAAVHVAMALRRAPLAQEAPEHELELARAA